MAQKKITDLSLRSDFDATVNLPGDDASQTWRVTGAQIKAFIAPLTTLGDVIYGGADGVSNRLAGNTTTTPKMLSQTGDGEDSAAPTWRSILAPTIQRFTSGSGTYTTPAGVLYIRVRMVGAGGGGGGSGSSGNTSGGTGGNTTFGTSLLTAAGGAGGNTSSAGGAGGSVTTNSPAEVINSLVGEGGNAGAGNQSNAYIPGGAGGKSELGTGGSSTISVGVTGVKGGGGSGASNGATAAIAAQGGGGAGGFIECILKNPDATYAYAVGAAGTAGGAGTSGGAGGTGGAGYIEVLEYYQ
jgi:hypothetical protein